MDREFEVLQVICIGHVFRLWVFPGRPNIPVPPKMTTLVNLWTQSRLKENWEDILQPNIEKEKYA